MVTKKTVNNLPRQPKEAGVVLIVALVMLVVISLASVAVMRNTMNADTVSDNARRQTQALQAAQAALRYCEDQIVNNTLTPTDAVSAPATQEDWKIFANWLDAAKYTSVPSTFTSSSANGAAAAGFTNPPQCMAQYRSLSGSTNSLVVITARGFSDNYSSSSNGQTSAGSVIWLQSIIQLQSSSS